jgi:hypothetical protein
MTQRTPTISIDARTNRPNAVTGFAYSSMGCGHAGCGKTPHTLLTASRDLAHSEAAVLAKRLRTMIERRTRSD